MKEPTLDTLTQRLDWLERENCRWLRGAALVSLLGFAIIALMGQTSPSSVSKILEAERFVLRDASGRARAILGIQADGSVGLEFSGETGKPAVTLAALRDGAVALELRDRSGRSRASLGVQPNGAARLGFYDQDGKARAGLSTMTAGVPILSLFDKAGTPRAALRLLPDGAPTLELLDDETHTRAVLGHTELATARKGTVEKRPAASLVLFDKDGKVIWRAP
ncbi:MAG: hypothetical protein HY725_12950 [Candidatus Rokubacteria bacterium]|nr:hypothetical protein [Candidatus Rokubacteria bacterium]